MHYKAKTNGVAYAIRTTRAGLSLGLTLLALLLMTAAVLADTVITDNEGISGFELYQNGLYWWSANGGCTGEFPQDGRIRFRSSAQGATSNLARDCTILEDAADYPVRDDAYFYFFKSGQLQRKALNALEGNPSQPLSLAPALPANQGSAPLLLHNGMIYWPVYTSGNNTSTIRRMPADGSQAPQTVTTTQGKLVDLRFTQYQLAGNGALQDALVWLAADGRLSRYNLTQGGSAVQLATGINDFALHTRYGLANSSTVAFAAQGTSSLGPGTAPGKLLSVNLDTATSTVVYNADIPNQTSDHNQVLAVTADATSGIFSSAQNVYITVANVSCGDLFCTFGNTAIHRHSAPPSTTGWQMILASGAGGFLRTDGQYLYYVAGDSHSIQRMATDAPAVELDFKADGVEVIQTIQDLDQAVKLIANKPTYARGYVHVVKNTTGKSNWQPKVWLRGFLNGVQLAGSPILPSTSPTLDGTADINALRNDLTRSYLFRLPDNWVNKAGQLTLRLEVDPEGSLPITGSRADDVVNLKNPAPLVKLPDSCLDFVRIHTAKTIGANPPMLAEIVNRARSLLPVQAFQVRTSSETIHKLSFDVQIECWGPFCVPVLYIIRGPFDLAQKSDRNLALAELTFWDTLTPDFGNCSDSHLVGMVDPSQSPFNGQGLTTFSNDLLVRMEPSANGTPAFNSPYGGRTLAHELGHNYGRQHIDQTLSSVSGGCNNTGPASPWDSYPYDECTLGPVNKYMGFDSTNPTLILPNMAGDLMSYANTRWTSDFTWNAVLDQITTVNTRQAQAVEAPQGPMLLVNGMITPTTPSAQLGFLYLFPDNAAPQSEVRKQLDRLGQLAPVADPFQIRQVDANGASLSSTDLILLDAADDTGDALPFSQYVPFNSQTKKIQIAQGATVLAEKSASANPPTLSLTAPVVDEAAQILSLQWNSSDPDNTLADGFSDVLLFTAQYSADNGINWQSLVTNYPWLAATVDARMLPGSTQALVRVIATDGFNTTIVTSDPFVLAKHPPVAILGGVVDGQVFSYTAPISLIGLGMDAEDGGLPQESLSWQLSGSAVLTGSGGQWDLSNLTPGVYVVTLTATDSDNQQGSTPRSFQVLPLTVADGTAPTLDGQCNDVGYGISDSLRMDLDNGSQARAWTTHAGGKLYLCISDLPLSAQAGVTTTVALHLDANNSGGSQMAAGDLGFMVDQEGVPYQLLPSGGVLQVTQTPQAGYAVVTARQAAHWNAEMAIAESLLDGWNHLGRMALISGQLAGLVAAQVDATSGIWPSTAGVNNPATWAAISFGPQTEPANQKPVAVAGDDIYVNITLTETVALNGESSFDAEGDSLTYSWTQVSGPAISLTESGSSTPSFQVAPVAGETTLVFQLVVNDGELDSEADQVAVILKPAPQPHTPSTFTPSDAAPEKIFLPIVIR